MGWRKPLGYDMQRRRYWALGGGTGAWRVYVEEQEGSLWGWYEGTLIAWPTTVSLHHIGWGVCVAHLPKLLKQTIVNTEKRPLRICYLDLHSVKPDATTELAVMLSIVANAQHVLCR